MIKILKISYVLEIQQITQILLVQFRCNYWCNLGAIAQNLLVQCMPLYIYNIGAAPTAPLHQ